MTSFRTLPLLIALAACAPAAAAPAPVPPPAADPGPPAPDTTPATTPVTASPAARAVAAALDSIFADPRFAGAFWGVLVRSLDTGETLYARNPEKMFVPASNMKIVTGAAALEALGPEYRYRTAVVAAGPVQGGALEGDLVVIGTGDPTISSQFREGADTRAAFRAWADSLKARGITRITGRIVGDDDRFDDVPLGRGWAWDDLEDYYAAEVSALELNEGVVGVRVAPGPRAGAPGVVTLDPPTSYTPVTNRTTTTAAGTPERVRVSRAETGPGLVVTGTIPLDTTSVSTDVAVRNNTAYFATVLREVLEEEGIDVEGAAVDVDALGRRPAARDTLFVHVSPPMREVMAAFMKPSQNQIGEMLLKTLGAELRGQGTAAAGAAVVDSLVGAWGLPRGRLAQADGSGLSRYNLVAPSLLMGILEHMTRSPNAADWTASLPVAGADGTLENRMRGTVLQGNVRAKTGTLSGVRALSGYLTTAAGERIVFSTVVNHHTLTSRDADRLAEAALLRLHGLPRR
jgi:serine-type D-Ala-D-Ala carboxypeptidase/endopeptidase (penicillin-binding protein 4)